jgi:hypothetical protein
MSDPEQRASVVLVHGAWADGSSWNDIIGPLLSKGLNVLAAPIPLTSLPDDIAALTAPWSAPMGRWSWQPTLMLAR